MEKFIIALSLYIGINALAFAEPGRGPSVEPLIEVDMENPKKADPSAGYDFNRPAVRVPSQAHIRVPANITTKSSSNSPYSYLGPFIFLITLPIGLWIMVSKKFKAEAAEKKVDYYGKTHQFKPSKDEHHSVEDDNDDIDYPKAS